MTDGFSILLSSLGPDKLNDNKAAILRVEIEINDRRLAMQRILSRIELDELVVASDPPTCPPDLSNPFGEIARWQERRERARRMRDQIAGTISLALQQALLN